MGYFGVQLELECDVFVGEHKLQGQLEETLYKERENAKVLLISSMVKHVLNSPNKSTMITDLIENHAQKIQQKSITILCIQKIMLNKTATT